MVDPASVAGQGARQLLGNAGHVTGGQTCRRYRNADFTGVIAEIPYVLCTSGLRCGQSFLVSFHIPARVARSYGMLPNAICFYRFGEVIELTVTSVDLVIG